MCADAETVIRLPPPVAQVVPRFFAAPREVADLILREARAAERIDHLDVQGGDQILVGQLHDAALDAPSQRGVLIEIEHVDRDVPDAAVDRLLNGGAKTFCGLIRQSEDQIDARSKSGVDRIADGLTRALRTVNAPDRLQLGIME